MRRNRWSAFRRRCRNADADIKGFLYPRMYRHARVERVMEDAERAARSLRPLRAQADRSARRMGGRCRPRDEGALSRRIGDYIAGMTDRYALIEHAKYFNTTPELR